MSDVTSIRINDINRDLTVCINAKNFVRFEPTYNIYFMKVNIRETFCNLPIHTFVFYFEKGALPQVQFTNALQGTDEVQNGEIKRVLRAAPVKKESEIS